MRFADRLLLRLGIIVYVLSFVVFFPRQPSIVDENEYLSLALVFRSGHITYDGSGIPASSLTVSTGNRLASKYPPGNSAFLVPFTFLGWRTVFVSGLLLALCSTLLFYLVLKQLSPDPPPSLPLLYLFYPAVVLFSRTVMSDLLSATLILASFLLSLPPVENRTLRLSFRALASGCLFGFACLVRYSSAILLPGFLLSFLVPRRRKLPDTTFFLAGLFPFALAALLYNHFAYGGPLRFPMYLTGTFSLSFFPRNFPYYALILLTLYPLMLFAPLVVEGRRRLLLVLPAYSLLLFYSFFSYTSLKYPLPVRALIDLRYLLPALPFFLLAYALVLVQLEKSYSFLQQIRLGVTSLLIAAGVFLHWRHDRHLTLQEKYRRQLLKVIPQEALVIGNADVLKLLHPAWGWRESRLLSKHGFPLPLDSAISRRDTVYAALLQIRRDPVELTAFHAVLSRFPSAIPVTFCTNPYLFLIFQLKPG